MSGDNLADEAERQPRGVAVGDEGRARRILVACVGNVLRGDDGFGVAVARRLRTDTELPSEVDVLESATAGISVVHHLMDGYAALIMVDAVDVGAQPGAIFVLEPRVPDPAEVSIDEWGETLSNLHLFEPSRVLLLARALDVLPGHVRLVGCQTKVCDGFDEGLSRPVEAAVDVAIGRVRQLALSFAASCSERPLLEATEPPADQAAGRRSQREVGRWEQEGCQ